MMSTKVLETCRGT